MSNATFTTDIPSDVKKWNDHRGSSANCVAIRGATSAPAPIKGLGPGQGLLKGTLKTIDRMQNAHLCCSTVLEGCDIAICTRIL